jgi:transcriptional regulator NrdR family protein
MRQTVRRFRECPKCNYKFFTYEIPEKDINDSRDYINKMVGG